MGGLLLVPLAYVATLITKIRLLTKNVSLLHGKQGFMATIQVNHSLLSILREALSLICFAIFGCLVLVAINFRDTAQFTMHCWCDSSTEQNDLELLQQTPSKSKLITKSELVFAGRLAKTILQSLNAREPEGI